MNFSIIAEAAGTDLGKMPFIMFGAYLVMLIGIGCYGYIKSKIYVVLYYIKDL